MASVFTTSRDIELLTSLVMGPLTTAQLLKLSNTFPAGPFRSPRTLLDRLQRLTAGGFVRRFRLAIIHARGGGLPHYYKLAPAGLRLLFGEEATPPSKQFFAPVAVARHYHTHSLAEFMVATAVAAQRAGYRLVDINPENTFAIDIDGERLLPDLRFDLQTDSGRFRFLVEIDCSTETIQSAKHDQTLTRKLRLHDAYQDRSGERHRVLFVCTRSHERVSHILAVAASVVRNSHRTLFLGIHLPAYLAATEPLADQLFSDHRGRKHPLVPTAPGMTVENQLALTAVG